MLRTFCLQGILLSAALAACAEPMTNETQTTEQPSSEADRPVVLLTTDKGDIRIELNQEAAPKTVENFLSYVKQGYYDGLIFHRVIPGFMVQGGGFDEEMNQKPTGEPIQNEADNGLKNDRGTLAMARTSDIHSATSQFFINLVDNDFLNHTAPTPRGYGYCVFAKVVDGMEVVDAIAAVRTGNRGMHQNVPSESVHIQSATVVEQD